MKIYTKGGDTGETGLYGGTRVPKDNLRIRAYGTLDELNAALGCVVASTRHVDLKTALTRIQGEIFQLGAELATPRGKSLSMALLTDSHLFALEKEIDEMESTLSPLKTFILPGGSPDGAMLHLARTICRRAERETVILHRGEPLRAETLRYLNRLGDHLFVCARFANHKAGVTDTPWVAPENA